MISTKKWLSWSHYLVQDFINSFDKSPATAYRYISRAKKAGQIKEEEGVLEVVDAEWENSQFSPL